MSRISPLPQPIQFGKYQLTERIANGRMAEVFKAKRDGVEGFEKILVVKRLYPNFSESEHFINAFVEEAKLTVSLSHANIVQVLDLGQQVGGYFMAMEYVAGYDLGSVMQILKMVQQPLPLDIAVFTISEVAKGLDYAHRRKDYNFQSLNIVHRDLCPSNVLISFEGEVKISDFGVIRALEIAGFQPTDQRRALLYASPEQVRRDPMTHRSDIFSLGLILYELVSGQHPYDPMGTSGIEEIYARAHDGAMVPVGQVADLPRAMEQIIDSMLQPNPEARVDSAGTLYEELISYLFASGEKADNRSLSIFMQGLRQHEDMVFPVGPAEPNLSTAGASVAPASLVSQAPPEESLEMELSLDDLEEVAHEVANPDLRVDPDTPNRKGTYERMAVALGPRDSALMGGGAIPQPNDGLPRRLSEMLMGLKSSRSGGAFVLSGNLGAGVDYVLDTFPDKIRARGHQVFYTHATGDDGGVPYSFAAQLIGYVSGLASQGRFDSIPPDARNIDLERDRLDRLLELGAEPAEHQMAINLFGFMETLRKGFHFKRDTTLSLIDRLLVQSSLESPLVILIDHADLLDPLSRDLLVHLASRATQIPVLFVLSATQDHSFFAQLQNDAGAALFESLSLPVSGWSMDEEAVLRGLSVESRQVLTCLTLAEQPLSIGLVCSITGLVPAQVDAVLVALGETRALRRLDGDRIHLSTPGLLRILFDELVVGDMPWATSYANALLGLIDRADVGMVRPAASRWTPSRIRLMAWAGRRREAVELASAYSTFLRGEGWREIAMDHCSNTIEVFQRVELGVPQADIDLGLSRAWLALELMQVDVSERALTGLAPKAVELGDDRRLNAIHRVSAELALVRDQVYDAFDLFQQIAKTAEQLGSGELLVQARLGLARWQLRYGNLVHARAHIDAVFGLIESRMGRSVSLRDRAMALSVMIDVLAQTGQTQLATNCIERLDQLVAQSHGAELRCFAALSRNRISRALGTAAAGLEAIEAAYNDARDHNLVALGVEMACEVAETAFEAGDLERTKAYGAHLVELGACYNHGYIARRGADLAAYTGVVMTTGGESMEALEGLNGALSRAQQRALPRDFLNSHVLLFRALKHLGSVQDAEHHRREAMRYAQECALGVGLTTGLVS